MKLNLILILFTVLQVSASVSAQNTRLDLKMQNATISQIFDEIERQSEVYFFYNKNQIDETRTISVDFRNKTIDDILKSMLSELSLTHEFAGKNVIIKPSIKQNNSVQQQKTVSGKVTDSSGTVFPGVSVVVKGTTNGTITDANGNYSLSNIPENGTLQFSFVGMKMQEVNVANQSVVDVVLNEETIGLDEVIAVGYGVMRKSDLTGSVGSVKADVLKKQSVASFEQGLQGKVAGVQVIAASGSPGGVVDVRIRGGNSLTSGNQPLYVIDGYPVTAGGAAGGSGAGQNPMATLNPNDIESMEILKDASATAIYGSRGANGVILITTKRGQAGETKVSYDGYTGVQQVAKKIDMMNATEWGTMANIAAANDARPAYYPSATPNPLYPAVSELGEGTDWQKEVLRSSAPIQNHNVTITGGSENTKFSILAGYYDQESVVKNQDFNRISFRNNIDTKISPWINLATSFTASRVTSNVGRENGDGGGNTSIINAALVMPPTVPIYNPSTGEYMSMNFLSGSSAVPNPVPYVNHLLDKGTIDRVLGSADLSLSLLEGLTLKISIGADLSNALREVYEPKQTNTGANANGIGQQQNSKNQSLSNENVLTYLKKTKVHSINAIIGTSALSIENKWSGMTARNFISDVYEYNNLDAGATWDKPNSGRNKNTLLSGFGRINYGLLNRYLITLTARADGSSKFGANNKWAFFPSVAGAWRIDQEAFMEQADWVSNLKLRASYGVTGNQNIPSYSSLEKMNTYVYPIGGITNVGIAAGNMPNPDLKWETTAITDYGIDFGFADNRINLTADYYYKKTTDLLWNISVPLTTGFGSVLKNLGSLENKGLELSLSAAVFTGDFKWNTMVNWSANRNKVLEIPGYIPSQQGTISGHLKVNGSWLEPGLPVGVWNLLKTTGVMNTQEERDAAARVASATFDQVGDMSFYDKSGDGKISFGEDRTIVGDPNPDFIFGWTNNFSYKNFDLTVYINGTYGNDIYNVLRAETNIVSVWGNQHREVLDYWTSSNVNAAYPRPHVLVNQNMLQSDYLIEDGSYVRLQNLTLGYNVQKSRFCESFRVYVTGQNLLTITNYSGYNPEVNSLGQNNLQLGVDYNAYPASKSFILGVNIGF
ncbi:MAG: TonB-dependent receptor [Prolixibacteraceae bacterium]|nr:TonB-dependent receptor [Prolixibacteraceae bacterium]